MPCECTITCRGLELDITLSLRASVPQNSSEGGVELLAYVALPASVSMPETIWGCGYVAWLDYVDLIRAKSLAAEAAGRSNIALMQTARHETSWSNTPYEHSQQASSPEKRTRRISLPRSATRREPFPGFIDETGVPPVFSADSPPIVIVVERGEVGRSVCAK